MASPRFHKNVSGHFYTTGECLACMQPDTEAPELFAPLDDSNSDTYFIRQPETSEEIEMACRAAVSCCVSSIRYGGNDPLIIRRVGNRSEYCDHPLPWWKFWVR